MLSSTDAERERPKFAVGIYSHRLNVIGLLSNSPEVTAFVLQRHGTQCADRTLRMVPAGSSRLLFVLAVMASRIVLAAQGAPQASERDVKAAYLYQFTKYIEWPATPAGSANAMTMCILGDREVAGALQKVTSDGAGLGPTVVIRQDLDAAHVSECHILFIGRSEEQQLAALLKALEGRPTLIAGDDTPFLRRGGMVAFIVQDRKLRFSVNLAAAEAAHLKVSSQLLRHAVQVIQ